MTIYKCFCLAAVSIKKSKLFVSVALIYRPIIKKDNFIKHVYIVLFY